MTDKTEVIPVPRKPDSIAAAEQADPSADPASSQPTQSNLAPAASPSTEASAAEQSDPVAMPAPTPPAEPSAKPASTKQTKPKSDKPGKTKQPATAPPPASTHPDDMEEAPAAAATRATVNLDINSIYHGVSFADLLWNWPDAIRAAILICDYLKVRPDDRAYPLLPARISLSSARQLQVQPASVDEAIPFVAPELADGQPATEATAVYHVAALIYYMLVNYPPVGNVAYVNHEAPNTPAALTDTLVRGLAIDPKERIATLDELRNQLFFVLAPPTWFEESIPKLPLDDDDKAKITQALSRGQQSWIRLRDRIPWQRVGQTRKRLNETGANPKTSRGLTLGGIAIALLIYLIVLTNII